MSSIATLELVPTQAVVFANSPANATVTSAAHGNSSNHSSNSTTSASTGAAANVNMSWKAGAAIGALVASPFLLGLGL